ncbi:hypothetical protein HOS99_gp131 [Staphylococcus phage phiSA_BS1]|uniref:Uncharacterized protein n=2 Tax=Baoshanvirus TaxID=2732969 RepID=A0A2P1MXT0_9CAUD|nr:hypothetical protein HOS99_gp131 [Staphylococcus phage phiSA_BS1]YP_009799847.1 hypothetical protein HOT02_gp006 [Staphylococcus phage phiSA_BS2]AVP40372.1 hypothetical protein [Staphylococcus phage phiSA_BS1]AVR55451.1 hypothetical protein phiSABS2_6 [Staphylococcus phage phiSA_BS2]
MEDLDDKFDSILEEISNMTDEQIESINKDLQRKKEKKDFILRKSENKDFDLSKMFGEVIDVYGSISTEDILYSYEDNYKHLYPNEEIMHQELESICIYINNFYNANKMEYPPFYIETYFGMDIFLRYNDQLFRYFYMQGQGTAEGFTKGGLDKKVKYCLNLNTDTVERI